MKEQMSLNGLVPDDKIQMPHEKNTTPQQNPFQSLSFREPLLALLRVLVQQLCEVTNDEC